MNDDSQRPESGESEPKKIVETKLDLEASKSKLDADAATEKIRKSRGSRIREEPLDLSALRASADRDSAEKVSGPGGLHPVRDGQQTVSLAVALWLVACIVGGLAAFFAWHPGVPGKGDNLAFVNQSESNEVISQFTAKGCAPFAYEYEKVGETLTHARDVLTGTALTEFDKTLETNRKLITQTKANADCHVDYVALSSLEGTRADLLTILIQTVTSGGQPVDQVVIRMQATMEKTGGEWLISGITDVG